jgi:hypothetical protein
MTLICSFFAVMLVCSGLGIRNEVFAGSRIDFSASLIRSR